MGVSKITSYVRAPSEAIRVVRGDMGTGTADAGGFSWVNPLAVPVWAQVNTDIRTAGTGTIDIGVSDDGTGADSSYIDGGTLALGVITSNTAGGTLGNISWIRIAKNGDSNDSIVAKMSDTTASTMVGTYMIRYYET